MLEHRHEAYKNGGLAIFSPEALLWVWLAQDRSKTDVRLFFNDFLHNFFLQKNETLVGIVAEEDIAQTCAQMYSFAKNTSYTEKEMLAYFLPKDVVIGAEEQRGLRTAVARDMPIVLEWLKAFYVETLHSSLSQNLTRQDNKSESSMQLYTWNIENFVPVAMGVLSGMGETCRINLVYVAPAFRGKGYGRAIVAALASKARENAQLPVLYTSCDNIIANGLYKSLGFQEAGRLTEIRFNTPTSL
ncbi:MAG: GNAT family N-acetyltransferase [Defluviitaleaceae bacterium]|nr:GNAT family N-acetyltransferase [Defluviitaleaceae bacterium]